MEFRSDISIHAPRAGRDPKKPCRLKKSALFQSTRPVRGATRGRGYSSFRRTYFNPRAPCGARPLTWLHPSTLTLHFNPRAPCGARLYGETTVQLLLAFQSTRPVRGATYPYPAPPPPPPISIHAPRAGRDICNGIDLDQSVDFNPRAPCGARLAVALLPFEPLSISIHAPRAGRDCWVSSWPVWQSYFNPRAPCGARQIHLMRRSVIQPDFNPRAPCGARPDFRCIRMPM